MSDLRDQTEPVGIFRELARTTWGKAHEAGEAWARADAECPPARVPTLADMAAWTADGATEDGATEAARTDRRPARRGPWQHPRAERPRRGERRPAGATTRMVHVVSRRAAP